MKYVRYDLYKNGELHSHGMLSHCSATEVYNGEDGHRASQIMDAFCDELPVPSYHHWHDHSRGRDECYFTPAGYALFAEMAEELASLINAAGGGWEARKREVDVVIVKRNHEVYYEDEFQIVASKEEIA